LITKRNKEVTMESVKLAKKVIISSVEMVHRANASHIGSALSMADILAVLYADVLNFFPNDPENDYRDRCLLSKGHACVSFYAVLAHCGFYPVKSLEEYGQEGSQFLCHTSHHIPGVEISAGSLGHGLPIGCGIAYSAKIQKKSYRTYVIVGDGEMDEGSNWEALLFSSHHKLDNLCLIIDYNKIQSFGNTNEVLRLEPFKNKLESFNWHVIEVDGHNHQALLSAFTEAKETKGMPSVVLANTIKGKGVSYMENELLWHYRSPNDNQYKQAMEELNK